MPCQPRRLSGRVLRLAGGAFEDAGAVAVLFFVGRDAFREGISVDSEHYGRLRKVLLVFGECFLYVELLKLPDRFVQEDVALQHLVD